jgi:iron complex transport system substrate-binding protein
MRPEVMIITSMARQAVFEQVKAEWQQWPETLPAVKNNRISPGGFQCSGSPVTRA